MAKSPYVWGIDIGKCALKALRCRASTDPRKLEAEAFEYIEYPMILTQPEADPVALVQATLEQLMSRHNLDADSVAVSVPGSLGLSKFIKLPPLEVKKIPDIVKYEARQQIPFPLEQVVWRWQRLAGGMEESGYVLDAEVAIFAMKQDQVFKSLAPLIQAGIRVDVLQLSPIALANMAMFDQLPDTSTIPPDDPVPFIALVSMGVDSTDLVVTNGRRIWQRSMPIGGSNFTKALVQGMKLTFARAENLKRNAVKAEDPKAVFKTMKPVFNEFAGELQRSLNYFTGNERSATIEKVLLLGNATKLRGLTEFVGQQLQLDVQRLDKFQGLEGASVVGSSSFREQHLAFGTAYGLALQGAGAAALGTNLLPDEIVRERIIESKKPMALATLVGLLAAALVSFAGMFGAWTAFVPERYQAAFAKAEAVKKQSTAATAAIGQVRARQTEAIAQQQWLAKVQNRRFESLDLVRAIQSLLPKDEGNEVPENPADRVELHIDRMDCQYFPDLSTWFGGLSQQWADTHIGDDAAEKKSAAESEDGDPPADGDAPAAEAEKGEPEKPPVTGPTGEGWVVELEGHHFHNESRHKPLEGAQYLRSTIIKNLMGQGKKVQVSAGPLAGKEVPVSELGIGFPIIVKSSPIKTVKIPLAVLPGAAAGAGVSLPGGAAPAAPGSTPGGPGSASGDGSTEPQELALKRYDFVIQFSWQPRPAGEAPAAAAKPAE
ncbi:MAG: type IV pilus assembly protein PilM [Planctomycetia bacterium]